jgi:hypothetical protein
VKVAIAGSSPVAHSSEPQKEIKLEDLESTRKRSSFMEWRHVGVTKKRKYPYDGLYDKDDVEVARVLEDHGSFRGYFFQWSTSSFPHLDVTKRETEKLVREKSHQMERALRLRVA